MRVADMIRLMSMVQTARTRLFLTAITWITLLETIYITPMEVTATITDA
jgi:hypothetical protein